MPQRSEEEDRILIADGKDFGELVFRLRKPSRGVILLILLRTSTTDPVKKILIAGKN